jgi:hypothetical protein
MADKNKAAQARDRAFAAGDAVRSNPYVQRVMEDPELRENLRSAFDSARKAYTRMSNSKGAVKAVTEDKKVQRELKNAVDSLKEAAESMRGKKKKRRLGRLLLVAVVGAGLALALSEDLRKKVLDTLFGAEEEFEYAASTTPEQPASEGEGEGPGATPAAGSSESETVGTS